MILEMERIIEALLKEDNKHKNKLKKEVCQCFEKALISLDNKNKILSSSKGIILIFNDNPKLKKAIRQGKVL